MARVNAIVLAGGSRDGVCEGTSAPNKAFVPVAGKPMVTRALEALRATPGLERVIVVSPPSTAGNGALRLADERRDAGERIVASLQNGVAGLSPGAMLMLVASDAPLLEVAPLVDFRSALERSNADLVYGIAEKSAHERRFPGVPHTWARMRDGVFCGGAVFGIRPRAVEALARFLDRLAAARKSPLRLASLFGWDVVVRFALGTLSIRAAERRASALLGYPIEALRVAPELAFNVDRKSDLALAERFARVPTSSG